MVRLEPWQHVPAARMAALYDAQRDAWRRDLAWDTDRTWPALDAARRDGRAGGAVAAIGDVLAGWAYWVPRGGELHCGALIADGVETTHALCDAVCAAADAMGAARLVVFSYPPAPGLAEALTVRGFALDRYDYFVRPLGADGAASGRAASTLRSWDVRDLDATAALFAASYGADRHRPFAGQGTLPEWRAYTRDITLTEGCGRFRLSVSRVVPGAHGALDGVALVTDLGDGSAHLAQLAVRPDARGRGLGRGLLEAVLDGATRGGFARLTLLVSRANPAARALYLAHGFAPQATFLAATRPRPTVSLADRRATPDPAAA